MVEYRTMSCGYCKDIKNCPFRREIEENIPAGVANALKAVDDLRRSPGQAIYDLQTQAALVAARSNCEFYLDDTSTRRSHLRDRDQRLPR